MDQSGQAEYIQEGIQWDDDDDQDAQDDQIVVRNRRMRQQSGERRGEMKDMDDDKDVEGQDRREDNGEEDIVESEQDSQIPQEQQTIVIDVSVSCFSYLRRIPDSITEPPE